MTEGKETTGGEDERRREEKGGDRRENRRRKTGDRKKRKIRDTGKGRQPEKEPHTNLNDPKPPPKSKLVETTAKMTTAGDIQKLAMLGSVALQMREKDLLNKKSINQ